MVVEEEVIGDHKRVLRVLWDDGMLVKRDVFCRVQRVPDRALRVGGSSSGSADVYLEPVDGGFVVYVCSGGECYATDIIGVDGNVAGRLEVDVCGEGAG